MLGIERTQAGRSRRWLGLLPIVLVAFAALFASTGTALAAAPTVTGLLPSSGPIAGGTPVAISGTGFTGTTGISFGGYGVTTFTVNNDFSITATSPTVPVAGIVNVSVTTPGGTSAVVVASQFTYTGGAGPVVSSLGPNFGPVGGGNLVNISGSGFTGTTSVVFGSTLALSVVVNTDLSITAMAPASVGPVSVYVRVTTGSGTSAVGPGNLYTYTGYGSGTVVTSLNPNFGPSCGGNSVTIYGQGFTNASVVSFGGFSTTFIVYSDIRIIATAPASCVNGSVYVVVTSPTGTSALSTGSLYTYGFSCTYSNCCQYGNPNSCCQYGNPNNCCQYGNPSSCCTYGTITYSNCCSSTNPNCCQYGYQSNCCQNGAYSNCCTSTYYANCVGVVVTGINPISGPAAGGNSVIINGSGFLGAVAVHFGTASAAFTVNSDIQITATAPPAYTTTGTIYIVVTGYGGTSSSSNGASQYLYLGSVGPPAAAPLVTSVSPASGPTTGGTTIMIGGSGFTGATGVVVGGVGTTFTVLSDIQIRAVTPAEAAGSVFVVVTTPGGTSGSTSAAYFTYTPGGPQLCPLIPLWVNDLLYGNPGGGFYWDPVSTLVWTPARGWHAFGPQPYRSVWLPLWADALTYGSAGGGFWWDPTSNLVWTMERSWHTYSPQGCIPR